MQKFYCYVYLKFKSREIECPHSFAIHNTTRLLNNMHAHLLMHYLWLALFSFFYDSYVVRIGNCQDWDSNHAQKIEGIRCWWTFTNKSTSFIRSWVYSERTVRNGFNFGRVELSVRGNQKLYCYSIMSNITHKLWHSWNNV